MNEEMYSDLMLERTGLERFGMKFEVSQVIARDIPVSHVAGATVFLTEKKQLYAFIHAQARLQLGDIRTIMTRMGLVSELFVPPKGHPHYFDDIALEKFKEIFPGRTNPSSDDLAYYRTLAPYNPALVQILEVKDGEIKQFDTDASGSWRTATKFTYRRIRTS